jgi:zinc transporter ZupT
VITNQLIALDPWALAFSAGAMIYVVVSELIPQAQVGNNGTFATWGFNLGFLGMMALEFGLPPI